MANDIRKKFAARLKAIIDGRPIVDMPGGPSRSYIYRMLQGGVNPSLMEIDEVLRAYGSSLGEFFAPWTEAKHIERMKLAAEIRTRIESILDGDVDLRGLADFLRVLDRGE